jgi:hypothetical protein
MPEMPGALILAYIESRNAVWQDIPEADHMHAEHRAALADLHALITQRDSLLKK